MEEIAVKAAKSTFLVQGLALKATPVCQNLGNLLLYH
jgi:hypothetical protein